MIFTYQQMTCFTQGGSCTKRVRCSCITKKTVLADIPLYLYHVYSSAWSLWQTRLQQQYDVCVLQDQALQHWALTLQSRVSQSHTHIWPSSALLSVDSNLISIVYSPLFVIEYSCLCYVLGLATVERSAHGCLLSEREGVQGFNVLHSWGPEKGT